MNKLLKIMYLKYVIGHCRHFCFLCKFKKNKCWEEMWEDIKMCDWKALFRYKVIKDNVKIDLEMEENTKIDKEKELLKITSSCEGCVYRFNNTQRCQSCKRVALDRYQTVSQYLLELYKTIQE